MSHISIYFLTKNLIETKNFENLNQSDSVEHHLSFQFSTFPVSQSQLANFKNKISTNENDGKCG